VAEKAVRQHVEASFAALDARLEQALESAAEAIEASGEQSPDGPLRQVHDQDFKLLHTQLNLSSVLEMLSCSIGSQTEARIFFGRKSV
jgi:hypothetical protein